MTTENIDGGGSFSAAEDAFFSSGGESPIPTDDGSSSAAPAASAPAGGEGGEVAPAPGAVPAPKGGDTIPLARFLEEKKSRKALETQVAELRGKFSIIERLQAGEKPPASAAPPTAEEDIFGAVKHVGETVAQMQKRMDDAAAAETAKAEETKFVSNYRTDADTFQAKNSDYRDAYNFVLNSRAQELMSIGYDNPADPTLTPDEKHAAAKALHDALIADEFAIAEMAFKKGKSPAEMLYGLAKQRGYAKAAAAPAPGAGEVTPSDAAPVGKGAETLDRIERGQELNKSLSTPAGATGDGGMTAERLLAMPMDEFETWCGKNPAAAKRIMGG